MFGCFQVHSREEEEEEEDAFLSPEIGDNGTHREE